MVDKSIVYCVLDLIIVDWLFLQGWKNNLIHKTFQSVSVLGVLDASYNIIEIEAYTVQFGSFPSFNHFLNNIWTDIRNKYEHTISIWINLHPYDSKNWSIIDIFHRRKCPTWSYFGRSCFEPFSVVKSF